ncbi:MAG: DHHA1 domain-containing protein [Candidatus Korarchaeota archaeon]
MEKWILTHSDADGITSGAIVLREKTDAKVFFTKPVSLSEDLKQVPGGSEVYILDIAVEKSSKEKIFAEINRIGAQNVWYIDHHPSTVETELPCNKFSMSGVAAAELAYRFIYGNRIDVVATRISAMGIIGDQFISPFLEKICLYFDRRQIYLESGILVYYIASLSSKDYDARREVLKYLAEGGLPSHDTNLVLSAMKEAETHEEKRKEIFNSAKRYKFIGYVINPAWNLGISAFYAAAAHDVPFGVGIREGEDFTELSIRVRNAHYDIHEIVEKVAMNLGGSGGGHPMAAGARLPNKRGEEFISEFAKALALNYNLE